MPDRYEVILVGITKQGRWLKYSGSTEGMRSGSWEQDASCVPCVLSPDRSDHGPVSYTHLGGAHFLRVIRVANGGTFHFLSLIHI